MADYDEMRRELAVFRRIEVGNVPLSVKENISHDVYAHLYPRIQAGDTSAEGNNKPLEVSPFLPPVSHQQGGEP